MLEKQIAKFRNAVLQGIALTALVATTVGAAAETTTIRMANPWPAKHPSTLALNEIFSDVEEASNGEIKLQMLFLDTVGLKQADLLRAMRDGVADAALFVPYYVQRDAPALANVLPTGGLITPEQALEVAPLQRAYAQKVLEADWNATFAMPFFNQGGRELLLDSREPINSLEGLKGKKVRHFERLGISALQELGVSAQTVPQAELYLALRTGVVDAAIHGLTNTQSQSIYEVTCCFSEFTPFPGQAAPYGIIIDKDTWESFPAETRAAIEAVGKEHWDKNVAVWSEGTEDEAVKAALVEAGMQRLPPFSTEDRELLQKVALEAWKKASEEIGPDAVQLYEDVTEVLGKTN